MNIPKELETVAQEFDLGRIVETIPPGQFGLVNKTYLIKTAKGQFAIQQLHRQFDQRVMLDALVVGSWLRAHQILTPTPRHTRTGQLGLEIAEQWWRVADYIPSSRFAGRTASKVMNAAKTLARFHHILADCDHDFCFKLEDFHATSSIMIKLFHLSEAQGKTISHAELDPLVQEVFDLYQKIKNQLVVSQEQTILHGDPKFDNFVFQEDEVAGIVDLDTLMRGSVLLDLGDAFRSWCKTANGKFDHSLFETGLTVYRMHHSIPYTDDEVKLYVVNITLELTARYLSDIYQGNEYFAWDKSSYPSAQAHNLERAKKGLAYANNIYR